MRVRLSKRELIVMESGIVLVCLFILSAIFYPYYEHYLNYGRHHQIICLSNMKQLATGLQMATLDNNSILPAANEWVQKSSVRSDSTFRCTASAHRGTKKAPDYMYVAALIHGQHSLLSRRALSDVRDPSATPLLVELANPGKAGQTPYVSEVVNMSDGQFGYDLQVALVDKIARFRHHGVSIVALADGHVEYLRAANINIALLMNSMTANEPLSKPVLTGELFMNPYNFIYADPLNAHPSDGFPGTVAFSDIFSLRHFIVIGRQKISTGKTLGAIMNDTGKVVAFSFIGAGKTFPPNAALPNWWDFRETANQPHWVGEGPAKTNIRYTKDGCSGLFEWNGEQRLTTSLVFKAIVPANTSKRIFMLNTGNGKISASAASIMGIEQTDTAGVTEDLHIMDNGTRLDNSYIDHGWETANGIILPLKNGYTYKITYRFN